ncbi:hypothetical protein SAMN06265370_104159 [Puniceibacterium sediminis]|uniref:Uncharacterized protein n=1 Tax=Puniceibacterium sediminis TaxID=1608407 RepID=A0A238W4W1_9RHOB|nr:hypothetical protein SAMN06265370_104159 [Puniceibacterium sediminis]
MTGISAGATALMLPYARSRCCGNDGGAWLCAA